MPQNPVGFGGESVPAFHLDAGGAIRNSYSTVRWRSQEIAQLGLGQSFWDERWILSGRCQRNMKLRRPPAQQGRRVQKRSDPPPGGVWNHLVRQRDERNSRDFVRIKRCVFAAAPVIVRQRPFNANCHASP